MNLPSVTLRSSSASGLPYFKRLRNKLCRVSFEVRALVFLYPHCWIMLKQLNMRTVLEFDLYAFFVSGHWLN